MPAAPTDGINFVDEDETRCIFAGLLKHIADAACADADEHFNEIGATNAKKGSISFTRDGLCEQGFAGTGRADHKDAFGNSPAETLECLRVCEELYQLGYFFDGL